MPSMSGLPDFSRGSIPKREKYTKCPWTFNQIAINVSFGYMIIPGGQKCNPNFQFQGLPKYTKIVIFGVQLYHLATVVDSCTAHCRKWLYLIGDWERASILHTYIWHETLKLNEFECFVFSEWAFWTYSTRFCILSALVTTKRVRY
jgi:hypothetical protein